MANDELFVLEARRRVALCQAAASALRADTAEHRIKQVNTLPHYSSAVLQRSRDQVISN